MTKPIAGHEHGEPEASARAPTSGQGEPGPEDLAQALRFVHLLETHTKARLADLSATVQAMLEVLVGEGQLPIDRYEERKRVCVQRENEREEHEPGIEITPIEDKYSLGPLPQVDCASRLALCGARCCTRQVALSVQDLDERIVRWNYSRPYLLAQRRDGSCVHLAEGRCTVYAHRPAGCRIYHCRDDRRIWLDFDARVPAPLIPDANPES